MLKSFLLSTFFIYSLSASADMLARREGRFLIDEADLSAEYQRCEEAVPAGTTGAARDSSIATCFDQVLQQLPEDQRERLRQQAAQVEVGAEFEEETPASGDAVPTEDQFASRTTRRVQDPVLKRVEDYLFKRLSEALYGEVCEQVAVGSEQEGQPSVNCKSGDKTKLVDHDTFYGLYESQLGKNIISSVSNYCLKAHPQNTGSNQDFLIPDDESRQASITASHIQNLQVSGTGGNPAAYNHWLNCFGKLDEICHDPNRTIPSSGYAQAKNKACVTQSNIEGFKKAILATKKLKDDVKKFRDEDKGSSVAGRFGEGREAAEIFKGDGSVAGEKSVNELTSLTSGEIYNKSGAKDAAKARAEAIQKQCLDNPSDVEGCRGLLNQGVDASQISDIQREDALRARLAAEQIKEFDEDQIKEYFKREGKTDEEIEKILENAKADGKTIQQIAESISNKYKTERDAIIAANNKMFDEYNISDEAIEDLRRNNPSGAQQAIETTVTQQATNLKNTLEGQVADFAKASLFNNVVSGFFSISDAENAGASVAANGNGPREPANEPTRNLESLKREFADSAFLGDDAQNDAQISDIAATFSNIKDSIEQNVDLGASTGDSENVTLDAQTIDTVFQVEDSFEGLRDREQNPGAQTQQALVAPTNPGRGPQSVPAQTPQGQTGQTRTTRPASGGAQSGGSVAGGSAQPRGDSSGDPDGEAQSRRQNTGEQVTGGVGALSTVITDGTTDQAPEAVTPQTDAQEKLDSAEHQKDDSDYYPELQQDHLRSNNDSLQ